MKSPLLSLALVYCLFGVGSAEAAAISSSSFAVSTTVNGNTNSANSSSQPIAGSVSQISAQASALTQTNLGGGSWFFNGLTTSALLSAARDGTGANQAVSAAASVVYTIAFTLGVGETADVTFDLGYTLQETGAQGLINWSLAGPQSGFSGSVTNPGPSSTISTQQVSLNTSGNYVFTLSGSIPGGISRNQSASVTLSNVEFTIVAVPEPGSALLAAAGMGFLAFRRRRIRA